MDVLWSKSSAVLSSDSRWWERWKTEQILVIVLSLLRKRGTKTVASPRPVYKRKLLAYLYKLRFTDSSYSLIAPGVDIVNYY